MKQFNDKVFTYLAIWLIILLNCYIYYLEFKYGRSFTISNSTALHFGASFGKLNYHGQIWRLFTAMWLHLSLMHLVSNMIALYLFARMIVPCFYTYQILLIYFISGLAGTIVSSIYQPNIIAAGASTAISGLLGAMLGFIALPRSQYKIDGVLNYAIELLLLNTIGQMGTNTDIAGHIGGAIAGFLISLIICLFKRWHMHVYGY